MTLSEERIEKLVKNKVISSEFLYDKKYLEMFVKKLGDFTGPFRKSMFVKHSEILKRFKQIGIIISKSKRNGYYYIIKEKSSKPILFDPDLLDI